MEKSFSSLFSRLTFFFPSLFCRRVPVPEEVLKGWDVGEMERRKEYINIFVTVSILNELAANLFSKNPRKEAGSKERSSELQESTQCPTPQFSTLNS